MKSATQNYYSNSRANLGNEIKGDQKIKNIRSKIIMGQIFHCLL